MAFSELQIALIGAGIVAVAMVWGYNAWQDRKHRKTADGIFKGKQADALLGDREAPATAGAAMDELRREPGEKLEPRFPDSIEPADEIVEEPDTVAPETDDVPTADVDADQDIVPETGQVSDSKPLLPEECADAVADCVLTMVALEPVSAPAIWALQNVWAEEMSKAIHWLARDDAAGSWRVVDTDDTGHYREWAVALQLVDRRGPVSESELGRFFDCVQQMAQETGAVPELPSLAETLARAGALDEFCAGVDIQFVLHVVEASGGVFAGTKLRGVAEAAGLMLESDGLFRERDATGSELFSVANLGAEPLAAESIKSLATHGLTLSLDVPRVSDGVQAFDHMLATARQLGDRLGGVLVDAQRAPLSDAMIEAIRGKTRELQARMRDGGISPGSPRALRLFS
ncbi:MAG: cell division protein ZipA C-terminal FtsZ-binding domain-containing protein [Sulfuritalea sp.]|nr:cell division protein ZipA C-terminal FtsZ-binding domain-containing protein [Sulfuritalea sp.]